MNKLAYVMGAAILSSVLMFGASNAAEHAVGLSVSDLVETLDSAVIPLKDCSEFTGNTCTGGDMKKPRKCRGPAGATNRCVVCIAGEPNKWSKMKRGGACKGATT